MTIQPDSADPETTGSIFDQIASTIASLSPISNFSANSPERAIVGGISDEFRERQHELLSVQLSARIQFAGKDITDDDLRELNIDPEPVDLELLNSFQSDQDLDLLVRRNGISRDPGSFATGEVTFQITADTAVIDSGVPVTTERDGSGDVLRFETTESASASAGDTQLTVAVQATERGIASNVGVGQLTRLPSPPPFVSSVSNTTATSGGENEETNAELRERFRGAIVGSSGGGTTEGVRTGLIESIDGLDQGDVVIDESASVQPGFDVIVDGGASDSVVQDEIDRLQPVAVDGQLVRPTNVTIDVTADVTGTNVQTGDVETAINRFLAELGLGSDVIRDQLVSEIITSDVGIRGIDNLTVTANGTTVSDDRATGSRESVQPGSVSVTVV
jgi:Uncharacterized homolog of phage Mu protein gp47